MRYNLYQKKPRIVLKEWIPFGPRSSLNTVWSLTQGFFHSVDVGTGRELFSVVENSIKTATNHNIISSTLKRRRKQSLVGALQLYSNKSLIARQPGLLTFCLLHSTALNLSRRARSSPIVGKIAVVAYLPAKFMRSLLESRHSINNAAGASRMETIAAFYDRINAL